ncbi:FMN-binding protein [Streptomyces sp. 35G-GA-8]|uniref:FMN-binding protein n=1 Tax=Streptomyces sp. 35G-GA-8 TaxID=2939434 RepID=UPI00201F0DFE|nr:FMN-binding protein [Streptomyces sp. 35G-GA-8]MCL7381663.1 FMN-binding protein [Streptomyces sp. 35G-GA-8]
MKRALPVLALTAAALIPLWRYEPTLGTTTSVEAAPSPPPPPASSPDTAPSPGGTPAKTVQGATVNTEKGPVQVEVTFAGDEISTVRMLRQPDHPQTTAAVPRLIEDTLAAQSADIDTVSGATITSDGYRESLQAAIDAKGA